MVHTARFSPSDKSKDDRMTEIALKRISAWRAALHSRCSQRRSACWIFLGRFRSMCAVFTRKSKHAKIQDLMTKTSVIIPLYDCAQSGWAFQLHTEQEEVRLSSGQCRWTVLIWSEVVLFRCLLVVLSSACLHLILIKMIKNTMWYVILKIDE